MMFGEKANSFESDECNFSRKYEERAFLVKSDSKQSFNHMAIDGNKFGQNSSCIH